MLFLLALVLALALARLAFVTNKVDTSLPSPRKTNQEMLTTDGYLQGFLFRSKFEPDGFPGNLLTSPSLHPRKTLHITPLKE